MLRSFQAHLSRETTPKIRSYLFDIINYSIRDCDGIGTTGPVQAADEYEKVNERYRAQISGLKTLFFNALKPVRDVDATCICTGTGPVHTVR